jgi:DNA invertase Pin-like site-specific DNA recombinase
MKIWDAPAQGWLHEPGFQRLVTEVCEGQIGAVFCLEASRLARNGRDWHHLIELCGLIGALLIDPEGAYDPRLSNDRLLLGLRGTMSEFELNNVHSKPFARKLSAENYGSAYQ